MRILPTAIEGVHLVDIDPFVDARGLFARTFCAETFAAHGLADCFPQSSTSFSRQAGTLRGLHFQRAPKAEAKLVRVTHGRVFDVAVDLRPQSRTYRSWVSVELSAERRNAIYIPGGCAHGFFTLEGNCELLYAMSETYSPELAGAVRWNDAAFSITWPGEPAVISPSDAAAPCLEA
jgi:dTDP-4-dehydrorhamnose 3,5-epimerase